MSSADIRDRAATKATTEARQSRDTSQPGFLSVAETAQLLRVSARSIQRRCHAGTLGARIIETKFGPQWEVDRAEVEKAAREAATHPRQRRDRGPTIAATEPRHVAGPGATIATDAPDSQIADRGGDDLAARYIARLETENDFLRATVEQHQRSEAELRAALREALKAAPRQLMSGTPEAPRTPTNRADEQRHGTLDKGAQIEAETNAPSIADFEEIESLIQKVFG